MLYKNQRPNYIAFILIFVFIKLALNGLALSHFGFHRDEFLHLVLADHLDWGYKEVPPFIALLAKISNAVFGTSVFAARVFPTIAAGFIIFFTGLITVEFGGKKFAIALACLAMVFSPAFAASDYLFQPVVFDQLWWVMAVWLLIAYGNTPSPKYLYWLGAVIGIGLLTKYTMAFFTGSLIVGLLISNQRKLLVNRHILGAAAIALLLFLPNLVWQLQHHLPVFTHMRTLKEQQLDYNSPADFIKQELLVNGMAIFVWLTGFIALLFFAALKQYRFIAFAFIAIFAFYLFMNGKPYYLFGAFPMLFAAGAVVFEGWLTTNIIVRGLAIALFTVPNLILFPLLLPIFPLNQTLSAFRWARKNVSALQFIVTWEDHKQHPTTQDYADMLGWDEMAAKVNLVWKSLTHDQQEQTIIYADNYGEAGAIHHFGKQYHLPEVVSLNSSFTLWAPDTLKAKYMIYVDDSDGKNIKKLLPLVDSARKTGEVENPLSREKGTGIFLLTGLKPTFQQLYHGELARKKLE